MTSVTETPHSEADRSAPDPFVVWVRGDMDLDHSARLRALIRTAVARAPRGAEIILDLQNSSFCDSTGLNELLSGRRRALESGHPLTLAAPSHQMVRMLEITRSIGLFGLCPAVPQEPPAGAARG
ncbi:STAS domain-containing protein [Streptomyces sp. NPDC048018]|uniref:STAS domain-containing protein n=1 Tax=Streptomyces sp. NPDC048018 TaxID=3365499 RepID=UPI003722C53A